LGIAFSSQKLVSCFYDVNHDEKIVSILAIGVKEGNRLCVGGQEFEL